MRALVLFDRDDDKQARAARALTLADFGVAEDQGQRPPSLLGYRRAPAADAVLPADTWTPKQLTYAGTVRPGVAQGVLAKAYDLVVNLVPEAFPPFDFLCAEIAAHLRAASHDEAMHAYDIVIRPGATRTDAATPPAHPAAFLPELRAYLRALNPHLHG